MTRRYVEFNEVLFVRSYGREHVYEIDGERIRVPVIHVGEDSVDSVGDTGTLFLSEVFCEQKDLG